MQSETKADVQFQPIRTFVTCSVGVDWLIIDKMANEKFRQDKKFPFFYKIKGLDPRGLIKKNEVIAAPIFQTNWKFVFLNLQTSIPNKMKL